MSRRYPLDPAESTSSGAPAMERGWLSDDGLVMRAARATAGWLLDVADWRRRHLDLWQAISGILLLCLGLGLAASAGIVDSYLHRGVEFGARQPYVVQPTAKALATNIDLRIFPDEEIQSIADALSESGFRYVRQPFTWAEIESRRGRFDWSQYDPIVQQLQRRDIVVIAVVSGSPGWSRDPDAPRTVDAPPRDPALLEAFTRQLAERYRDGVGFVQVWDHPNLASSWGGVPATGATFLPVLVAASNGAKAGNPTIRVLTPELAVTSDAAGGQDDLAFLRDLYANGAEPFFDIIGIVLDGGTLSPDDRRVEADRQNMSRAILFRDLMLSNGDQTSPIWATSYGWAVTGDVSRDEQAEFVVRGLERSWSEWPWMGLMIQWAFFAPSDSPRTAFAIVQSDGTATPLYRKLTSDKVTARAALANTGFAPMNSAAVSFTGNWQDQPLEGRTFRTTRQVGSTATMVFQGTGVIAYVRSGPEVGRFLVTIDGKPVPGGAAGNDMEWDLSIFSSTSDLPRELVSGLDDERHTITISLTTPGELTLGGMVVERDPPFVWPIILMTVGAIIMLFFALHSFAHLVAVRAGHVRRRDDIALAPPLPRMPNWQPGRRA